MREILKEYNFLMSRTFFDLPCVEDPFLINGDGSKIIISQLCTISSRVFKNSWDSGGLLKGSWWSRLDIKNFKKFSQHMLIDDQETSFIDFSSLLPRVLALKFGIKNLGFSLETIKKQSFVKDEDQLNYMIIKGMNSANINGFFRSFCNDKKKLGINQKITKSEFVNFLDILESSHKSVYKLFFSKIEFIWENIISEIFFQLLQSTVSSNIALIKVRDKIYYPTKVEDNIVNYTHAAIEKVLRTEDFNIKKMKCLNYSYGDKQTFLESFLRDKLKYSTRFLDNKKKFYKTVDVGKSKVRY